MIDELIEISTFGIALDESKISIKNMGHRSDMRRDYGHRSSPKREIVAERDHIFTNITSIFKKSNS
jgi:hypothetical protein